MENETEFKPQKFAVIGAGPVGCIVAASLAKIGYDVTLCDIVSDLVKPAKSKGIVIEGAIQFTQKVTRTCTHIEDLAEVMPEVIIITAKANALHLIISAIEGFYQDSMYVVSWQNGISTEYEIAETIGKKGAMRAVVNYGCNLTAPAKVHVAFHHPPHYIQDLDPASQDAAQAIAQALTKSGLTTLYTDQIVSMVWRKSIMNSALNPVCAVTGLTMSQTMHDPIIFNIVSSLLKEGIQVARANEISLGWEYFPRAIEYLRLAGNHKPSMLVDIENNRKTEIDFMNGKIIEYGIQVNIETPYNMTMRALLKGLESKQT